jgi:hypothetical protein
MSMWQRMTLKQKVITVTALTAGVALLLYLLPKTATTDPPISVGDGSVTFSAANISKNSNGELEALTPLFHKVHSLAVSDYSGGSSQSIDLTGKQWTIISVSRSVVLTNDRQVFQEGVKADCPQNWTSSGNYYTCDPGDGSQLTPATLTIAGQNCPTTNQPTCTLTCASGKCRVLLDYK